MSYTPTSIPFAIHGTLAVLSLTLWLVTLTAFAQTQQSTEVRELPPNQTLEREMMGAETHRYKFDLKLNDFFQVRIEQKGIDVLLKLLDANGLVLATMGSPSGRQGPETLSWVAEQPGSFVLEVNGFDVTAEKGNYTIKREASRTATAQNRRRVEVERLFVAGIAARDAGGYEEVVVKKLEEAQMGWQELNDAYLFALTALQVKQLKDAPQKAQAGTLFAEARRLANEGAAESKRTSVLKFNEARTIYHRIADKKAEADCLGWLGYVQSALGEKQKALEFYDLALPLYKAVGDRRAEATTLSNIGAVYENLGEKQKALEFYNLALPLRRAAGDKGGEASTLNSIGAIYDSSGEPQKALEVFNLALPLRRAAGDKGGEATTLNNIGAIYDAVGEKQKALEFYDLALPLRRAVGDKRGEAITLGNLGVVYDGLGERQKALESYNLALPLLKVVGDSADEAATLVKMGQIYDDSGEPQKALEFYNLALPLWKALGNKRGEAATLNNIGLIYFKLGENQKALEFYNLALLLRRTASDRSGEANSLSSIGLVYDDLGEGQKALEFYNRALLSSRDVGDTGTEAATLNNIGLTYDHLGDKQKAFEFYNRALPLYRAVGDRNGEALTLTNIGGFYGDLGNKQKALEFYNSALPIWKAVGDRGGEARTLDGLQYTWLSLNNPRLAIFYGKQAVNANQQVRGKIHGLERETQQTFLKTIEIAYWTLATTLIAENRLDEATQVINLLRDQEFFDFDRDATQPPRQAFLNPHETTYLPIFEAALEGVVSADEPLTTLKRTLGTRKPIPAESTELKRLQAKFNQATADFQSMLKSIETDFKQAVSAKDKIESVPDAKNMQSALRELSASTKQKTAALYALIGDDRFHLILIQADGEPRSFESQIKAASLNKKILQFYAVLQSPAYDPRPLGKELYDIIFKPVEVELKKAGVQTVMWQLDGNLRYVPMAALFDGEKYLVERFQNAVFTRADKERITRAVSPTWTGTGFGNSHAYTVDVLGDGAKLHFDALPGVTAELASIFRTRTTTGILDGDVFADAQFTKSAFYAAVKQRRPLVHVSSHFAFRPGDDSRSFLLLGDGTPLTLNELKKQTRLFEGVELLTLSACNTAATLPDANGREIDGFAELAQRLGAGAVMASLWAVADKSTALLMSEFYRLRKENPQLTKAAALQLAQREMIDGKLQPSTAGKKRDTGEVPGLETNAPTYAYDPKRPYAHPYYWSPFILIGNFR